MTPRSYHRSTAVNARFVFILAVLCVALTASAQEGKGVILQLLAGNNHGQSTPLSIGVHEFATTGIDPACGEVELPPMPPTEIYDARLVGPTSAINLGEGALRDLRPLPAAGQTLTEQYRIVFQAGRSWPSVTLRLPSTIPAEIRQMRIDGRTVRAGDSVVSLLPSGDMNIAIDYQLVRYTYALSPATVTFVLSSRDTALPPPQTVQITPSPADASWYATPTVTWMELDRTIGTGQGAIAIRLRTQSFGAGRTTGEVHVQRNSHDAPAVITVHVDFVTSTQPDPAPSTLNIGPIYPNPVLSGGRSQGVTIRWSSSVPLIVGLSVHDALGRRIRASAPAGFTESSTGLASWDLRDDRGAPVPPGLYLLRISAGKSVSVRPVIVE